MTAGNCKLSHHVAPLDSSKAGMHLLCSIDQIQFSGHPIGYGGPEAELGIAIGTQLLNVSLHSVNGGQSRMSGYKVKAEGMQLFNYSLYHNPSGQLFVIAR